MKTQDVIDYYGGRRQAAAALGVTRQALEQWGVKMPYLRACQVQVETEGAMKAPKRRK